MDDAEEALRNVIREKRITALIAKSALKSLRIPYAGVRLIKLDIRNRVAVPFNNPER